VFVFFGLVAVGGTTYVQTEHVDAATAWVAGGIGALACTILVANNLRDIRSDTAAGKRTLAVVLGDPATRTLFVVLHLLAVCLVVLTAADLTRWALLALVSTPLSWRAVRAVRRGASGAELVAVLRVSGLTELLYALGLAVGLAVGAVG
jgi:1,4-dihydroxy-2-naphthoate polyprenyltransferase